MADILKKCAAAVAETKKSVGDAAGEVKKWQSAYTDLKKKKIDGKNRDKLIDQANKSAADVLKAHQRWTKLTDDFIRAVAEVDVRVHDMSNEVAAYDKVVKDIVPGLKKALELEEAEMIKRFEELFGSF
jgi:hypothetical protein